MLLYTQSSLRFVGAVKDMQTQTQGSARKGSEALASPFSVEDDEVLLNSVQAVLQVVVLLGHGDGITHTHERGSRPC